MAVPVVSACYTVAAFATDMRSVLLLIKVFSKSCSSGFPAWLALKKALVGYDMTTVMVTCTLHVVFVQLTYSLQQG